MSEFSDPEWSSLARIRELASLAGDGNAYERWKDIEKEIRRMCRLSQSDWIAQAPELRSETLVFLIRQSHRVEPEVAGHLLEVLIRRILRLARRWVWGLDDLAVEQIVLNVETSIVELVLSEELSRQGDFLEIAFAKSVEQRTLNAIEKHKNSTLGHRGFLPAYGDDDGDDSEEIERPIESAPDGRPGPLALLLQNEDLSLARHLIGQAYKIAKDPRFVEAAILHYGHGWPIRSKTGKPDVVSHFKISRPQAKYWASEGLKALRVAAEPYAVKEVAND